MVVSIFAVLCNLQQYLLPELFILQKKTLYPLSSCSSLPPLLSSPICCIVHISRIIPYVAFCVWFFTCIMWQHVSELHFFSWLNNISLYGHTTFVYSSDDGHLSCLHLWLLWIDCCSENSFIQIFILTPVFEFLGCVPRNSIAKLYGNYMFNLLRNCQTVFPKCLHHFSFSLAMYENSIFFHILTNTCYFSFVSDLTLKKTV